MVLNWAVLWVGLSPFRCQLTFAYHSKFYNINFIRHLHSYIKAHKFEKIKFAPSYWHSFFNQPCFSTCKLNHPSEYPWRMDTQFIIIIYSYVLGLSVFTMVRDCSLSFFLSSSVIKNPFQQKQTVETDKRQYGQLPFLLAICKATATPPAITGSGSW